MMKHITFLTTILASPFLIQAMDEPEYKIPQAIITHRKEVTQLCTATYLMLQNFKATEKNSISKLVKVIELTASLKLSCPPVLEREMGFYVCRTNPKLDLIDSLRSPFSHVPNNIKAGVFFAHLTQYHDSIGKKGFVSPNETTAFNYLKQQKIEAVVAKNAQRKLIIPEQTIKEVVIPAPSSVDITEFAAFAKTIEDFLKDSPEEMFDTIELFYHNELNGKNPAAS